METLPTPVDLFSEDLAELCEADEAMLRRSLEHPSHDSNKIRVALIPDVETMSWHHAREDFVAQEILRREPKVKGLHIQCDSGNRVWCIWSRFFGNASTDGNTLYILRMVIEGEKSIASTACDNLNESADPEIFDDEQIGAVRSLLRAAQIEAAKWEMNDVQIWNPSPTVIQAAKQIQASSEIIYREDHSIASIKWHSGDSKEATIMEWIGNEKYGWC
ncbi:MAG: hypothetical protein Q9163_001104 [Psora crenata]